MALSARQIKILKWILRFSYLGPLVYWVDMGLTGGLGAQPIVKINTQTGYVTLVLILINLLLGIMIALWKKWPAWWRWIFAERRSLGIAAGIYAVLHFCSYLGKEGFQTKAWTQIYTKFYLSMGFCALALVLVLTLTSNNLSVRLLSMRRWRFIHRFVHLAGVFILLHLFLIEKANLALLALLTLPLVPFQIYRLLRFLRKKSLAHKG